MFSKPKVQKENSMAETSGEHRGGKTTTSYSSGSPRKRPRRKGEVRRVKRGNKGGKLRRKQNAYRIANRRAQSREANKLR
jgi:hypothetical protein